MNDIIYIPRTGKEMMEATGGVPIRVYSNVCRDMEEEGAVKTLTRILRPYNKCIILLQDPHKMNSGHWTSVSVNPQKKEIYFCSSYGGKPDEEKNRWIPLSEQIVSNQSQNPLNDSLKEFCKLGYTIYYNDFPYQREGDKTATCGIWVAAFLNSGMNPDEFAYYTNSNGLSAFDYYRKYFLKSKSE